MVEGPHTVVELGEAGGHSSDGELGLGLGEPDTSIIRPELGELNGDGIDVNGNSSLRSGSSSRGFGHPQADGCWLAETKHCRSRN